MSLRRPDTTILTRISVLTLAAVCISASLIGPLTAQAQEDRDYREVLIALAVDGNPSAAYQIARLTENDSVARHWLRVAAEEGHSLARCVLARRYDPESDEKLPSKFCMSAWAIDFFYRANA